MATRLYGLSVGETEFNVTEGAGSATVADTVELTVDLATSVVGEVGGTTRTIRKEEVLLILEMFMNHITKSKWPPA